MRILQIAGLSGPGAIAGGVWRVAAMQSEALRAAGHRVTLLSGWLGPLPAAPDGQELVRARQLVPGLRLRFLVSIGLRSRVRRLAAGADVAHVHLCRDFMTVVSVLTLHRCGVPVVAQMHGMVSVPRNPLYALFDRLVFRRVLSYVDTFLALGRFEADRLEAMGIDADRIVLVDNAVPEPGRVWDSAGLSPESPFVFLSRLHERKRPATFARAALARIADGARSRYVVAGPDEGEASAVAAVVSRSGHGDRFDLLPTLDHDEALDLLARARAMVLPSIEEPYPMIVLEAASVGTPVVMTSSSGIAAMVRDAGAGLVVEPETVPLAEAMRLLEDDDALCARLGREGRQLYLRRWRPEALATFLTERYRLVVGAQRAPQP